MGIRVTRAQGRAADEGGLVASFTDRGLEPRRWANGPGERYETHRHDYHKVLYCLAGSIVFHFDGDDVELGPGDRLDVEAGTDHGATVGPHGVRCVEAPEPYDGWGRRRRSQA